MALDVFLQEKPGRPAHGAEYEEILCFEEEEEEGYYWFLYPLFQQLQKRTGQFVDQYGVAIFGGDNLDSLANTIAAARQLTENHPEEWDVVVGFEVGPARPRREIRQPVNKARMLSLLDKLQTAIAKATEKNYYVAFWGD
ncbi:hypothetical protein IAD21_04327 [Abditibacteriota bacterium]|nr:hypothetical protein IAD21_04327 [Abditibacteriota bacterium]